MSSGEKYIIMNTNKCLYDFFCRCFCGASLVAFVSLLLVLRSISFIMWWILDSLDADAPWGVWLIVVVVVVNNFVGNE